MKTKISRIIKTSLVTLVIAAGLCAPVAAQAAGKSIGLRPLKNDIKINPGQTITRTITVVNNTKETRTAVPALEVFDSSTDDGYPDQLRAGDTGNPQEVTNWIDISMDTVTVPPFSTQDVEYSITAPENAEPGGHYGAILFEDYDPNPSDGIKINVRVASLLLVRVAGEAIEDAEITEFSLNKNKVYDDKALVFDIRITNLGNVHFAPEGRIILKNSKGEVLTKVGKILDRDGQEKVFDYIPVNYAKGHVLPQSSRLFEVKWEKPLFNEKITAELAVAYSDIKEPVRKTLELTLNRSLEVQNFKFDLFERKFTLVIKNSGNVLIKPLGAIKIYNSFDFQVDELAIAENDDYLKQGEERTYNFNWNKDVPTGKYTAIYEYTGDLDELKSEPIVFIIGNPFLAMLLSWQGVIGLVMMIVIIVGIIILKKRKNKPLATKKITPSNEKQK